MLSIRILLTVLLLCCGALHATPLQRLSTLAGQVQTLDDTQPALTEIVDIIWGVNLPMRELKKVLPALQAQIESPNPIVRALAAKAMLGFVLVPAQDAGFSIDAERWIASQKNHQSVVRRGIETLMAISALGGEEVGTSRAREIAVGRRNKAQSHG